MQQKIKFVFNKMTSSSDNIQVCVRVRPFHNHELKEGGPEKCIVSIANNAVVLTHPNTLLLPKSKKVQQVFTFDKCFWSVENSGDDVDDNEHTRIEIATQENIFAKVGKPLLENILMGFNGCIMAYGQSGSGKTYTMMGDIRTDGGGGPDGDNGPDGDIRTDGDGPDGDNSDFGIIPRICHALFHHVNTMNESKFQIEMSYLEIYAEQIRDLLSSSSSSSSAAAKSIRIREHPTSGPFVENLTRVKVDNFDMIQQYMTAGSKQRITASTNLNDQSSRAHAMFYLFIKQLKLDDKFSQSIVQNKLCLVDLAGSERVNSSGVTGIHFQEASHINTSLTALGRVISILARNKKEFVPFRDSPLTWMLKDNLSGNSKTVMMATLSPSHIHYEETLSTLQYAYRTKQIVNHVSVNTVRDKMIISKLAKEIQTLNEKWTSVKQPLLVSSAAQSGNEKIATTTNSLADDKIKWDYIVEESKKLQNQSIQKYKEQLEIIQTSLQFPFLLIISEPQVGQELVYYLCPGTTHASVIHPQFTFKFFHDEETGVWLVPMDATNVVVVNDVNIEEEPQLLYHGDKIAVDTDKPSGTIFKFKIPICAIK